MTGTAGNSLTINTLPPTDIKRWTFLCKAQLVLAVRGGLITQEHACERYGVSPEEFLSWERSIAKHGTRGLRATRSQEYR